MGTKDLIVRGILLHPTWLWNSAGESHKAAKMGNLGGP
jgi:hypothetical protein